MEYKEKWTVVCRGTEEKKIDWVKSLDKVMEMANHGTRVRIRKAAVNNRPSKNIVTSKPHSAPIEDLRSGKLAQFVNWSNED